MMMSIGVANFVEISFTMPDVHGKATSCGRHPRINHPARNKKPPEGGWMKRVGEADGGGGASVSERPGKKKPPKGGENVAIYLQLQ